MLSEKPWKPEAVLRLGLGLFLCVALGALLSGLLQKYLPGTDEVRTVARLLAGVLGFHVATLVLVSRLLREHHTGWWEAFGVRKNPGRASLFGGVFICLYLPAGMALLVVTTMVLSHLGWPVEEQTAVQILREAGGWPTQALLAVITIVLAPVAEEMLFRGVLYPVIKQADYPRAAWWGTALLFAAIHFNLPSFPALLLLALLLTWLYEKTDNLLAPVTAHSLFNALNFAMLHFADKLEQWRLPHP